MAWQEKIVRKAYPVISSEGLTNIFVENYLAEHCHTFRGVFSADRIPNILALEKRFSIVVNLSNYGEIGSHFIAIIVFEDHVIYIDVLGEECTNKHIKKYLDYLRKPIQSNIRKIQSNTSRCCGFFAIVYVMYFERPTVIEIVFHRGEQNLYRNDDLCIQYIIALRQ
ncbi:MAG: hypothetical protein COA94_02420 [Rickettsiales bacterium]|nr:MAG: hypothetical protein COA94_02420 [Rickettsiales bacterium]